MNILRNQQGVALLTALMLTLISFAIVMGLLYMMRQNLEVSASHKRYKTALEAAYGSVEVAFNDVVPLLLQKESLTKIQGELASISPEFASGSTCLDYKLNKPTAEWPESCSQGLDPASAYDIGFTLKAAKSNVGAYKVYTKIVDTRQGNTDLSGRYFEGFGVVEANITNPQHLPYVYRMEVQASAESTKERAQLSVVYGF
jgi:hypothetical protein